MCTRIVQDFSTADLANSLSDIGIPSDPRGECIVNYNARPTDLITVARNIKGTITFELMFWKYKPAWATARTQPALCAKLETIASTAYFRDNYSSNRVAIPVNGWYGWDAEKKPYYFTQPESPVTWLAGVIGHPGFAVITQAAAGVATKIGDRMPAFILPSFLSDWLNPEIPAPSGIIEVATQHVLQSLTGWPVGDGMKDWRRDGPELIASAGAAL